MKDYYNESERFKAYVDQVCKSRDIDVDTALSLMIVKEVYKYYKSVEV